MPTSHASSPDAVVDAKFKSDAYSAKLEVVISCTGAKPTGEFNMFVSGADVWRITSDTPRDLNTEANPLSHHVHASFVGVTVKNESSGKDFTECTAFFDASKWPLPGGVEGVNVTLAVYHGNKTKPVFEWDGIFQGTIEVLRDVTCGN